MKTSNTMKKWVIGQSLVLALGVAVGSIGSAQATHKGDQHGKGPQFSLDTEAFCGDPVAMVPIYDAEGAIIGYEEDVHTNVAVRLTDVSDDNGPEGAAVGLLTIECLAPVKQGGRGKPSQVEFATIEIEDPGFGIIEASCPLGSLPGGATEWKARATASDGDVRRPVSDNCEEVAAP